MGADIHIDGVSENRGGYFRDSYNATCLLHQLGISWWMDVDKMLDKNGKMSVRMCKKFRDMIKSKQVPHIYELDLSNIVIDNEENSRKNWRKMFVNKRRRLLAFLQRAINLKIPN